MCYEPAPSIMGRNGKKPDHKTKNPSGSKSIEKRRKTNEKTWSQTQGKLTNQIRREF